MKKNQKVHASWRTKQKAMFAAFMEAGVFGKIGLSVIILFSHMALLFSGIFGLLAWSQSAKAAVAGDKVVKKEIDNIREGVFAYGKHTLDDSVNNHVISEGVNMFNIAIGGPVEEALAEHVKKITSQDLIKRYFKALGIKDKTAVLMIRKDGDDLLEKLAKKHGPIIDLEKKVLAKKLAKRAK